MPSLMEFVSNNLHVESPQRIFELGKVTLPNKEKETKTTDEDWLAALVYDANASFTEIKSCLDAFLMNLAVDWNVKETMHQSFIDGRVGAVMVDDTEVGLIGEVHPRVLEAWALENPVAAFELNMEKIIKIKSTQVRS